MDETGETMREETGFTQDVNMTNRTLNPTNMYERIFDILQRDNRMPPTAYMDMPLTGDTGGDVLQTRLNRPPSRREDPEPDVQGVRLRRPPRETGRPTQFE